MGFHAMIAVVTLLVCTAAGAQTSQSSCWILTNLKGEAVYKQDGYKKVPDGFMHTNPHITLIFSSGRAQASGDDIQLVQVGNYSAVGVGKNDLLAVVETYLVDPDSGTALYTKSEEGRGLFDGLTSAKMLKGDATPCR